MKSFIAYWEENGETVAVKVYALTWEGAEAAAERMIGQRPNSLSTNVEIN